MKNILFIPWIVFAGCSTTETNNSNKANPIVAISEHIDINDSVNILIISYLEKFLETKNQSHYSNDYWSPEDFSQYYFPFLDLYKIEKKDTVDNFYRPTLLEIVNTDKDSIKLVKLAYIGETDNNDLHLKSIYNIIATVSRTNKVLFSNPLGYMTRNWQRIPFGSIDYVISPKRSFNKEQADLQQKVIAKISDFYKTAPLEITYYSCTDAQELFRIKGFDYDHRMYLNRSGGGLAVHHNIILSANNSEEYIHEILHLYNSELFPSMPKLLNEGIATYIGGSSGFEYSWHKNQLRDYISNRNEIDFSEHLEPFEDLYIDNETSIPYVIGALICERTFRLYGESGLFNILSQEGELWEILNQFGLTKQNFDEELKRELMLPPALCMMHIS